MRTAVYQEIIITWSKKIPLETIEDFAAYTSDKRNVLYQLYGDHHIYGQDTLLYIGKTVCADSRMRAHLNGVFGYVNNLSVSIGVLEDYEGPLEIPESILIASHKPSYNKEFIHDLPREAKQRKIIVINNGHHAMLKACCLNFWWVD